MDPIVQAAIVSGGFGLATIAVSQVMQRRQGRHLNQIRDQVANSHETNLRDDVDRVLEGVETLVQGQRQHSREIAGLREDLRVERMERAAGDARLDDHLRTQRPTC
ncbi:DUF2746 domain-containing protein [Micromonospora sp. WMMD736]|uniref:DUF2746 domain-containing protein n=1 Tax=Micromonospora sp. WMMD736 TaxID=3404112 RepID=UPI003B923D71